MDKLNKQGSRVYLNKKKCHFCVKKSDIIFRYDLNDNCERYVLVCRTHFGKLCIMTYVNNNLDYLPVGQKEYISIKHLESQLNVVNTIQFK